MYKPFLTDVARRLQSRASSKHLAWPVRKASGKLAIVFDNGVIAFSTKLAVCSDSIFKKANKQKQKRMHASREPTYSSVHATRVSMLPVVKALCKDLRQLFKIWLLQFRALWNLFDHVPLTSADILQRWFVRMFKTHATRMCVEIWTQSAEVRPIKVIFIYMCIPWITLPSKSMQEQSFVPILRNSLIRFVLIPVSSCTINWRNAWRDPGVNEF